MSDNLKPCPFCGGTANGPYSEGLGDVVKWWSIRCNSCNAVVVESSTRDGVIAFWNTRVQEDRPNLQPEPDIGEEDRQKILEFCPRCLASSKDGSWGFTISDGYCANCGSSPSISLPLWAIRSIRRQASWVGKRYYPQEEDKEIAEELKALRLIAPDVPSDQATEVSPGHWLVKRELHRKDGKFSAISIIVSAQSADEALKVAKPHLPFPGGDACQSK